MSECCLFVIVSLNPAYLEGESLTICFTVYKVIITRESDLGALRPIWLFSINLFIFLEGNDIKIVGHRHTKSNWINPWQFFYWLLGNNIKRVGPRYTKDH